MALARKYAGQRSFKLAEIAYEQALNAPAATKDEQRTALLAMARLYRRMDANTRAAACYETYLDKFSDDGNAPQVYLELGRTLRALGAYRLAMARFYSVINSTLRLSEEGVDRYRIIAKTAQYEIAQTYFEEGEYVEASRYFSRIQLLDLAPADRERAQFKAADALVLAKRYPDAEKALRAYLDEHPKGRDAAEAQYLLATVLRKLGRNQEAFDTVLALLRTESTKQDTDPTRWAYWKQRTGNRLANEFFEDGRYWSALVIYQALVKISRREPSWRWAALYQVGLCYERLGRNDLAAADYQHVVKGCAQADQKAHDDLGDIQSMASWRLSHLKWKEKTAGEVAMLFHTLPPKTDDPTKSPDQTPGVVR